MEKEVLLAASLGERSVFEELLSLIERHSLSADAFPLGDFYDTVNALDREFQIFNSQSENANNISEFNKLLNDLFRNFIYVFSAVGFRDDAFFYSFKRFLAFFSFMLKEAGNHVRFEDVRKSFFYNFPSLNFNAKITNKRSLDNLLESIDDSYDSLDEVGMLLIDNEADYDEAALLSIIADLRSRYTRLADTYSSFYKVNDDTEINFIKFIALFPYEIGANGPEKQVRAYCNDFHLKLLKWSSSHYNILQDKFYMRISITVNEGSRTESASKMLSPLWMITSALDSIKNVSTELENIAKGSIKLDFEVHMEDEVAKEEVNAVWEGAKEIIKNSNYDEINQKLVVSKNTQIASVLEEQKLNLEIQKLTSEIALMPSAAQVEESIRLDNERKSLENELLKTRIAKAKRKNIKKLSILAAEGATATDDIRVDINGILYLLIVDNGKGKELGPDVSSIS